MKKIISLFLILALCLGLAACGKTAEAPAQETAAPELVYTARFQALTLPEGAEPTAWAATESGLYLACYEKLADGQVPEGKTLEYEGQYDLFGSRLYAVGEDGTLTRLGYESLPAPENTENRDGYSASTSLDGLFPGPDGGLIAVENQHSSWYDGPEGLRPEKAEEYWSYVQSENRYVLRLLDGDGNVLQTSALEQPDSVPYLSFYSAATDAAGRLYVSSEGTLCVYETDGSLFAEIPTDGWVYNLARLRDGSVAAQMWDNGLGIYPVDVESQGFGQSHPAPYAEVFYPGSGAYEYYYTMGTGLYGYDPEAQEDVKLLNWLDCDLYGGAFQTLTVAEDGTMRGLSWDRSEPDAAPELIRLEKTVKAAGEEKTLLTLGALYPDEVSRAVLKFNRSHDNVRIVVRDYSEFVKEAESMSDETEALTKLSTEIMAGNMPDLLSLDSLPYAQLAMKGLLEDLYPWLDADGELRREDFFENVLAASEVKGGLYQVSPGFSILSLLGASSVVGDAPGWTYEDFNAALASMPEGCTALGPYVDREQMLMLCLFTDMDSFVDWSAPSCRFDSEDFEELLAFVASFPQSANYEPDPDENDMTRIAEGKQMLIQSGIYSIDEVVYNEQYFAGQATYIGFPTRHGSGNVLYRTEGYAMSSTCADKDAAWDFLRDFLTEDYQSSDSFYSLPVNRAAFQKKLDKAMEVEYETDDEGHYLLDENGERIPVSKGGMGLSTGEATMEFDLYAVTEEQAQKLLDVIDGATKSVDMNLNIYNIVQSEAAAYFAGQKTAAEVAKLIQSKANLYLSEQA